MEALNILVVEDNAIVGELLADLMAELGHRVCAVEATEDGAVAAAAHHKPDLVIVDVQLGRGSGITAIETIVRTGHVAHLFVSGNVAEVLALRPNAVTLQKPYSEAALLAAIERALAAPH